VGVGCSGAVSGAGRIHLKKFGFLEEQINDGLAKNARKREKC